MFQSRFTSRILAGVLSIGGVSLGADVASFDARVIENRDVQVKEETVKVRQIEDVTEVELPWKGEQGIKVKYDMGAPSLKERTLDRRDIEIITENKEGEMKIDFILNEKPSTNRFCQTIEGAEHYKWSYQEPLTPKEQEELSIFQPENVAGSYAVYHKTLANQKNVLLTEKELAEVDLNQKVADGEIATTTYKGEERYVWVGTNYETGKAFHVYRPQVWEVNNKEATTEWAELSYENGELCVTAPQDFLNSATYPVRVDPTFGYTSAGATSDSGGTIEATTVGKVANPGEDGSITSLHAAIMFNTSNHDSGIAVYNRSTEALLSPQSDNRPGGTNDADTFITYSITGSISVSNQDYALVAHADSATGAAWVSYDSGGSSGNSVTWNPAYNYPTWDSFANFSNTTNIYSIYATYTADAGGGESPTPQSEFWFNGL